MNSINPRRLQIVVLAAGFSSRLGRPKALVRVHGLSLLRKTLKVASNLAPHRIMVVAPRNATRFRIEARDMQVRWLVNAERAQGLSSSVRRAIDAAHYASAVLLLPADLINLESRDLVRLVRRWHSAPRRLIARRIGSSGATPVILPRWLYSGACSLTGDVGLRAMISQLPAANRVLVTLRSAACDVDTPQDLSDARRRFRRPS